MAMTIVINVLGSKLREIKEWLNARIGSWRRRKKRK